MYEGISYTRYFKVGYSFARVAEQWVAGLGGNFRLLLRRRKRSPRPTPDPSSLSARRSTGTGRPTPLSRRREAAPAAAASFSSASRSILGPHDLMPSADHTLQFQPSPRREATQGDSCKCSEGAPGRGEGKALGEVKDAPT